MLCYGHVMPGPHWSKQDFKDAFEEDAAWLEYCQGMTREEAEAEARRRLLVHYKAARAEARRMKREEAG